MLIEHLQKNLKDGVPIVVLLGLAVDVEQNDFRLGVRHASKVTLKHSVTGDLLDEKVERSPWISAHFTYRFVTEKVRQDLNEVRFAGSEKARDPNAHLT